MLSVRKKIRGKRRKYQAVDRWREKNEKVDFDSLTAFGAQYARLDIKPWNNSYRTGHNTFSYWNPPLEFQIYILQCMLELYDSWNKQLANRISDLQLWIYQPEFVYSLVSLTRKDVTPYNEEALVKSDNEFPVHRFPGLRKELEKFHFSSFYHDEEFYENESFGVCQHFGYRRLLTREQMLKEMVELGAIKEMVILDDGQIDNKYTLRKGLIWTGTV